MVLAIEQVQETREPDRETNAGAGSGDRLGGQHGAGDRAGGSRNIGGGREAGAFQGLGKGGDVRSACNSRGAASRASGSGSRGGGGSRWRRRWSAQVTRSSRSDDSCGCAIIANSAKFDWHGCATIRPMVSTAPWKRRSKCFVPCEN